MHDGCTGPSADGKMIVNKVRMMGFSKMPLPAALEIPCSNCGEKFMMDKFETSCPGCDMVHAVTPCSADDPSKIKAGGIGI